MSRWCWSVTAGPCTASELRGWVCSSEEVADPQQLANLGVPVADLVNED